MLHYDYYVLLFLISKKLYKKLIHLIFILLQKFITWHIEHEIVNSKEIQKVKLYSIK